MTPRSSVRLVLLLVLGWLALAACGGDDPEPTEAAGASTPSASEPEQSQSEPSTGTSGGTELSDDGVAACAELEAIVTDITSEYPDGVGLSTDAVPGEQQVAALNQLVTNYEAADVPDELSGLRDSVVVAAEAILARAEAAEPVTEDDTSAFTSAFADLGILCESAS